MTDILRDSASPGDAPAERLPLDPGSEVYAYVGDARPPEGQVYGVIVADAEDPGVVARRLRNVSETTSRLAAIGSRLQVDLEEVLEALEEVARVVPGGVMDQEGQLSEHDQATLREAGLLRSAAPAGATKASARAAVRYSQLLSSCLTVKEAAIRLRVGDVRVRQRLGERSLYGFQAKRGWCVPDFQFGVDGELPALKEVVRALPADLHPLSVEGFFTGPKPELVVEGEEPMSVVDWLAAGRDPQPVVELARDLLAA